jgi:hypothetical protein
MDQLLWDQPHPVMLILKKECFIGQHGEDYPSESSRAEGVVVPDAGKLSCS